MNWAPMTVLAALENIYISRNSRHEEFTYAHSRQLGILKWLLKSAGNVWEKRKRIIFMINAV